MLKQALEEGAKADNARMDALLVIYAGLKYRLLRLAGAAVVSKDVGTIVGLAAIGVNAGDACAIGANC